MGLGAIIGVGMGIIFWEGTSYLKKKYSSKREEPKYKNLKEWKEHTRQFGRERQSMYEDDDC